MKKYLHRLFNSTFFLFLISSINLGLIHSASADPKSLVILTARSIVRDINPLLYRLRINSRDREAIEQLKKILNKPIPEDAASYILKRLSEENLQTLAKRPSLNLAKAAQEYIKSLPVEIDFKEDTPVSEVLQNVSRNSQSELTLWNYGKKTVDLDLTPLKNSKLTKLGFYEKIRPSDKNILLLRSVPIHSLEISDASQISGFVLAHTFPQLTDLRLRNFKLSSNKPKAIGTLKQLKKFSLVWTDSNSPSRKYLIRLIGKLNSDLTRLSLTSLAKKIHYPGLTEAISQLSFLTKLSLNGIALHKTDLNNFTSLRNLKFLKITGSPSMEKSLIQTIAQIHVLEKLHIEPGQSFNSSYLNAFQSHRNLQVLTLESNYIDSEIWQYLAQIPYLRKVSLGYTLEGLTGIEKSPVMSHLKELSFSTESPIDPEQIEKLIYVLPNLEVLKIHGDQISQQAIAKLVGLKKLHTLVLSGTEVGSTAVEEFPHFLTLKKLILNPCKDSAVKKVTEIRSLEELEFASSDLSSDTVKSLGKMQNLDRLSILGGEGEFNSEMVDALLESHAPFEFLEIVKFHKNANASRLLKLPNLIRVNNISPDGSPADQDSPDCNPEEDCEQLTNH